MKTIARLFALSTALAIAVPGAVLGQEKIGESEFRANCAVCHGLEGRGDGPVIEWMKSKPKSLRLLAKENNGVFPWQRVYDTIEGTRMVAAHGPREMPVWGNRYAERVIHERGYYGGGEPPGAVRGRILELVFYLAIIQDR